MHLSSGDSRTESWEAGKRGRDAVWAGGWGGEPHSPAQHGQALPAGGSTALTCKRKNQAGLEGPGAMLSSQQVGLELDWIPQI